MRGATFAVYGLTSMLIGALAMLVPLWIGIALAAGYTFLLVLVAVASE